MKRATAGLHLRAGERVTPVGLAEQWCVAAGAVVAAIVAAVWSARHHAFLLYGDAEAHVHIARRLFDSHRPGLGQLGSVWLPLPHLLLVPFVAVDGWWRSGFAGVMPSALCYVLACVGLYRLMRKWIAPVAAVLAICFFALNPNLLYLATTAMSEPLFLCELIWAVLLAVEWHAHVGEAGEWRRMGWLIAVLMAAVATRYDGWALGLAIWVAMAVTLGRRGRILEWRFVVGSFVLAAAPTAWMIYNAALFGDWLDFLRGPYSASAIELRTAAGGGPPHPGWHNPWVSVLFFGKAAEMDAVAAGFGWVLWIAVLVGMDWAWRRRADAAVESGVTHRKHLRTGPLWTLLLWLPLPFYAYSVAWGSVPIFLPVWWPHSWYNTRYGMELLPGLAVAMGFLEHAGSIRSRRGHHARLDGVMTALVAVAIVANAVAMMREGPLVLVEGEKNAAARETYNEELGAALARLHEASPDVVVLMDTSTFPSIVARAGMSYRETINESDKEYYLAALDAPSARVGAVLGFKGDEVWRAAEARPEGLRVCRDFAAAGQAEARLWVSSNVPASVCEEWR